MVTIKHFICWLKQFCKLITHFNRHKGCAGCLVSRYLDHFLLRSNWCLWLFLIAGQTVQSGIRWGAHWRHLACTIERPMHGIGTALSNYFDHFWGVSVKFSFVVSHRWLFAIAGQTSRSRPESPSIWKCDQWRIKNSSTLGKIQQRAPFCAEDVSFGLPAVYFQVQRLPARLQTPRNASQPPRQATSVGQHHIRARTQSSDRSDATRLLLPVLREGV